MGSFIITFILCLCGFASAIPDEPGKHSIAAAFFIAIAIAINTREQRDNHPGEKDEEI